MGSGGAKKTNQMLAEETRRSQAQQDEAARRSAQIYGSGRGDIDWGRSALKDMYTSLGQDGGGGGGGGGYTPAAFTDETYDFWRNLMKEGAYSPTERGAIESSATSPIKGIYEGLLRNLGSITRGAGLGAYGAGSSLAAQDAAYQASEASKGAFANIAQMVAASKERGATGLEDIETKRRAFEEAERARARAAAGRAAAGASELFGQRRSLIHDILGLEGDKDLAYMDRELAGRGQSIGSVNSRVSETPMWQRSLASLPGAAMSAAAGAFTGGLSNLGKKKSKWDQGPAEDQLAG